MITYAGIGTRSITDKEKETIEKIADKLSSNFILFSGNAPGSDQAFQTGSHGNCVIYLPWASFESDKYDFAKALDVYDLGKSSEGIASISKYHPNSNLKYSAKMLMARNFHQIMGYKNYPQVSFVVCCAEEDLDGNVLGGTGFACRLAKDLVIPIVNIRVKGWQDKLSKTVKYFTGKKT